MKLSYLAVKPLVKTTKGIDYSSRVTHTSLIGTVFDMYIVVEVIIFTNNPGSNLLGPHPCSMVALIAQSVLQLGSSSRKDQCLSVVV